MDLAALRARFPVLERVAYLNTGSVGPMPAAACDAVAAELERALADGRASAAAFARDAALADRLRAKVAGVLGCAPWEVALTGSTTDGVNAILAGLDLQPGDEIVTTAEEHPGLLAPLAAVRDRRGVELRVVPFEAVAAAVGPRTRLVACSHVSWQTGRVADVEALAAAAAPVLLDGAQGLGALAFEVGALGCEYYAAAGQKWLCGPVGSGYLYVAEGAIDGLAPAWPGYGTVADTAAPLDSAPVAGAARFDMPTAPAERSAWALAALDALAASDLDAVRARAVERAAALAAELAAAGLAVAPRGASTLVSWEAADPAAEAARLLAADILVRDLPGTPYVRASVGGWTADAELERLVAAATSTS